MTAGENITTDDTACMRRPKEGTKINRSQCIGQWLRNALANLYPHQISNDGIR